MIDSSWILIYLSGAPYLATWPSACLPQAEQQAPQVGQESRASGFGRVAAMAVEAMMEEGCRAWPRCK
jgi:hypothetical protein